MLHETVANQFRESEQAQAESATMWWENNALGRSACPMCGSHSGMEQHYRGDILRIAQEFSEYINQLAELEWYRLDGCEDMAFTPCCHCRTDTSGYEPITRNEFLAWLYEVEWECNCVLPSQSCPACRAAAREAYGDGIPF